MARETGVRAAVITGVAFIIAALIAIIPNLLGVEIFGTSCKSARLWTVTEGDWSVRPNLARYRGKDVGIVLTPIPFKDGQAEVTIATSEIPSNCQAQLIFGQSDDDFFSGGLGGEGAAFSLARYVAKKGWQILDSKGQHNGLQAGGTYHVVVEVRGGKTMLHINDVTVAESITPNLDKASRLGLIAENCGEVEFACVRGCS